jgi:hypothetical protein
MSMRKEQSFYHVSIRIFQEFFWISSSKALAADELCEVGDANEVGIVGAVGLEEGVQSFEDSGLPVGDEVGFAAEFGVTGFAAQKLQRDLGFELKREGPKGTRMTDTPGLGQ